ncbi:PIR protein, putative [Plasmodium sp. gorilla clade G1]|nr:PIR protein, putative [Plasmodium sp. gorilla clade G1]
MNVHYINILLFALPLNILVHYQSNHKKTIFRTSKTKPTKTHRTLCECELYEPSNYDNDPEMKELMENFNHQTSERLREYDEIIQDKRKQCKEQCEKDIQKIILKDNIEKELTENFGALKTHIRTEDIPTCVCEKSLADKTEKVCLNCGKTMGAVAPAWGLVSGLGYAAWTHYVAGVAAKAATDAGVKAAIKGLGNVFELGKLPGLDLTTIVTPSNFNIGSVLAEAVQNISNVNCVPNAIGETSYFCLYTTTFKTRSTAVFIKETTKPVINVAETAGELASAVHDAAFVKAAPATNTLTTAVIASVVSIVLIVLVMLTIYLILRYRQKKK